VDEQKQVSIEETDSAGNVSQRTTTSKVATTNTGAFQASYIVYYIVGLIEVLLTFRLVFKLLGANPSSPFVSFIYSFSAMFVAPFAGIFHTTTTGGVDATAVLEPATVIAMIVYALLGWGIAKLIGVLTAGKN
jgi:hypothetical protein